MRSWISAKIGGRRSLAVITGVVVFLSFSGCEILFPGSTGRDTVVKSPGVELKGATLTAYPDVRDLGAWYCPELIPSGGQIACNLLLGPRPAESDLVFQFRVDLEITNPNSFPIPVVEMLVALSLFPEQYQKTLAAVCVGFCEPDDPTCTPLPLEGQCSTGEPEILTVQDLTAAALKLLILVITSEATGGPPPDLSIKTIPAYGRRTLNITLAVSVRTMLDLLEAVFSDRWAEYLGGQDFVVKIPYGIEGTVWFVVEGFGKFPIGFGPIEGSWTVR